MTSAFGGQHSIQLSYGCSRAKSPSPALITEAGVTFNAKLRGEVALRSRARIKAQIMSDSPGSSTMPIETVVSIDISVKRSAEFLLT